MAALAILLILGLVGGAISGYVALAKIASLRRELQLLKKAQGAAKGDETGPSIATMSFDSSPSDDAYDAGLPAEDAAPRAAIPDAQFDEPAVREKGPFEQALNHLRNNWMIWLGGACVTLAGIFFLRYSIEQGLLGPTARIVVALAFGGACHAAAELLRRRDGETTPALAALAGAGSIILYAALLASFRLYELVGPGTAFLGMALVAGATMIMARLHGPLLAAFGIVGAYLVPILLSTGGGSIRIALLYALIVSGSALLLMRYVYRPWLWWGFAAGALGWWLVSTTQIGADGMRTLYLTALGYMVFALPTFDWMLRRELRLPRSGYYLADLLKLEDASDRQRVLFAALLAMAAAFTVIVNPDVDSPWTLTTPMLLLALILARQQEPLYWFPWVVVLGGVTAWLAARLDPSSNTPVVVTLASEQHATFLGYLLTQAAVAASLSLWLFGSTRRQAVWASLATLAPLLLLTLAYLLMREMPKSPGWAMAAGIFALVYLGLAGSARRKLSANSLIVWLFAGGHLALALAAAMVLESASLTLALAAQLVSLGWIVSRFELPGLGWLLKLVVALVVARLTLNPWLPDYPPGVHWSLWTYGGSTLFAAGSAYLLRRYPTLARWTAGAGWHLLVLTLWAELRYQLYEGRVFAEEFTFVEAVLTMALFGALAAVYSFRARLSTTLKTFYSIYSAFLMAAALGLYGLVLVRTAMSHAWVYGAIGDTIFWNFATLAYGLPVLVGLLLMRLYDPALKRRVTVGTGFALFVFVSLSIRHLWTGNVRLDTPTFTDGELYTYSAVWLAMALGAMLGGIWRYGVDLYRAGLVLLLLVTAKLFLVDMAGLEGLLRVASFMGLGLALLGISYLHQRMKSIGHERSDYGPSGT